MLNPCILDSEATVGIEHIDKTSLQMLASIATVGITQDDDGTFVVIALDIIGQLCELSFTSRNILLSRIGIHMEHIDIDNDALCKGHIIYAEAFRNQAIGTLIGKTVVGRPLYTGTATKRKTLETCKAQTVGISATQNCRRTDSTSVSTEIIVILGRCCSQF